jgi:hypothetical protein
MMVMDFDLLPPFNKNFYVELLIGARNQQVYGKTIEKTPTKLKKIYDECVASPSEKSFEKIWDGTNMLKKQK